MFALGCKEIKECYWGTRTPESMGGGSIGNVVAKGFAREGAWTGRKSLLPFVSCE